MLFDVNGEFFAPLSLLIALALLILIGFNIKCNCFCSALFVVHGTILRIVHKLHDYIMSLTNKKWG